MSEEPHPNSRIDRLLDAIELIKVDHKDEAAALLRELIRENGNFEDAWLWMSVAVSSMDQSVICLDNVLRVNPGNAAAASALYRLRESEIKMEKKRANLRFYRDLALGLFWILVVMLLYGIMFSYL